MKYVIVDLEMNYVSKENRNTESGGNMEIIEIGAVVLDENFKEIDNFLTFVKPQFNNRIERKIEKLTGITKNRLKNAPDFVDAIFDFFQWCDSQNDELIICQWSENDIEQIKREVIMKEYILTDHENQLLLNWHDIQKEYGEMLGLEKKVSLENALNYAGIDFEGKQHDALFDARNTAVIFQSIRNNKQRKQHYEAIIDALKPHTAATYSLGDLFDFKAIYNKICIA